MKVNETPSTVPAATTRVATGSGQQVEQPAIKDKVSVPTPQNAAAIQAAQAVSLASSGREARVQEVINAVKNGQYYPSPQQIAQQLVSEAEVDAHLQAMLAK